MKEIILTQNRFAIVDDEDFEKLSQYKWHFATGYAMRKIHSSIGNHKTIQMHREILGDIPDGLEVDHIDRNKLNNRKCNLRICKPCENMRNQPKRRGCSSKFKGVRLNKYKFSLGYKKVWDSRITKDYKEYWIGLFETEEQAALAYNLKAKELFGEFASLNEVENVG